MTSRRARVVGREDELEAAAAFLASVRGGAPGLFVVEAEAGAGKTSLLREIEALTTDDAGSWTVRWAEGDPNDPRALRCLAVALDCRSSSTDPTRARIAALLAGAPARSDESITSAVHELLLDVVERSALERPLLLVVDDLHWVDDASLGVLGSITRRLRGLAVGVLGASRPSPRVHGALDGFRPGWLPLGPLSDESIATIAHDAAGVVLGPSDLAEFASIRTNPFLVGVLAADRARTRDDTATPSAAATQVLARVTSGLGAPLRALLELAAVAGREIDATLLARAADLRVANVVMMVNEAIERGLLHTDGDVVRFRHDLYAEALVSGLPVASRDELHLRLGRTVAAAGNAPGRAAFHLDASAYLLEHDDVVLAGRVVDSLPHDDTAALALAQRAHELAPHDPRTVVPLMRCLAAHHRHDEVVRLARPFLVQDRDVDDERFDLWLLAAASLARSSGNDPAIALLREGLADDARSIEQRVDILTTMARLQWYDRDVDDLRRSADEALRLSRAARYLKGEVDALCVLSESAALVGDAQQALRDAEDAVRLAARVRGRPSTVPQLALGVALVGSGRLREGLAVLSQSVLAAERTGDSIAVGLANMTMTSGRLNLGDWDEFVAEADAMVEIASETGVRSGIVFPLAMAAVVSVRRGERADAIDVIARLRVEATRGDANPSAALGGLIADMAEREATGRLQEAADYATWAADALASVGMAVQAQFAMDATRLAWTVGDLASVARMATILRHAAEVGRTPTRRAMAEMAEACASQDLVALVEAARTMASTERAWDAAVAHHVAAVVAARAGARDAASLFAEAADRYEALGSRPFVVVARAGLGPEAVHDARFAHVTPAGGDPAALDRLTNAERRVLALVAEGAANGDIAAALYVSKRTVESHLAALYRKLEVSTRVGLARAHDAAER